MQSDRLRVLVVHNAYQQRGGEDRVVEDEIELLRKHGHEVCLFTKDNRAIVGQGTLPLMVNTLWSRSVGKEMRGLIRSFKPDVMHVHNTFPQISPVVYWEATRAQVPVVQTLHNFRLLCAQAMFLRQDAICEDCLGRLPWRGVVRKCYRNSVTQSAAAVASVALHRSIGSYRNKVTRFIALSEFAKEKFIASGQIDAQRLVVKPNFVDLQCAPDIRPRHGGLFVGRLSREKGIRLLAAALAEVEHCEIDVIGTGPEQAAYAGNSQMRFLGWREKPFIFEKLRNARYLVLPSICFENFPRTLVEAFASGLPVIAGNLGAMPELIQDGVNGLLFAAGSAHDLASKMAWADGHPDAMAEMGRRARSTYETKFTADSNYRQLVEIYCDAATSVNSVRAPLVAGGQA